MKPSQTSSQRWIIRLKPSTGFMKIGRFFLKMDKMIGKDFERGLERLRRTVTEHAAQPSDGCARRG